VLSDGAFSYPDHSFFVNAPEESLEQVFREHNIPPGEITVPWICLFINTGQQWILVDTGAGAGSVPTAGKLLQNLQAEGVEPVDVDMVIITHGHPDHIGGNTDSEGRLVFPNARYVMCKDEWEFWMSEPDLTQLKVPEEIKQTNALVRRQKTSHRSRPGCVSLTMKRKSCPAYGPLRHRGTRRAIWRWPFLRRTSDCCTFRILFYIPSIWSSPTGTRPSI